MAPGSRRISQEAFLSLVKENMEEFDMSEEEAIIDAKETLIAQGVDISGIVISTSGIPEIRTHPLVLANERLLKATESFILFSNSQLQSSFGSVSTSNPEGDSVHKQDADASGLSNPKDELFHALESFLNAYKSHDDEKLKASFYEGENVSIKALVSVLETLLIFSQYSTLDKAIECLTFMLTDHSNRESFQKSNGPFYLMKILEQRLECSVTCQRICDVMSVAGKRFDSAKKSFMDLSAPDLLMRIMHQHVVPASVADSGEISADVATSVGAEVAASVCSAIRMLSTADDINATASNAFKFARLFAEKKFVEILMQTAKIYEAFSSLVSEICITTKTLAVNDEICQSISRMNGISYILKFLKSSINNFDSNMAISSLSLIKQLAKSDENKKLIAAEGGIEVIISSLHRFMHSPMVLQESFGAMAALSLRSPETVRKAMEEEIMETTISIMKKHYGSVSMLGQACAMIRNFAVRNPELRPSMLAMGLESLLQSVKKDFPQCKEIASFALRDLGINNYLS